MGGLKPIELDPLVVEGPEVEVERTNGPWEHEMKDWLMDSGPEPEPSTEAVIDLCARLQLAAILAQANAQVELVPTYECSWGEEA